MLAGNLASICVGGIVASLSSYIVSHLPKLDLEYQVAVIEHRTVAGRLQL